MNTFEPVKTLKVLRRMSDGSQIPVGRLAQNPNGVYFQFDESYLIEGQNISPFKLPFNRELVQAPHRPHRGLHGVFADSLPDGWGLLIMDRIFRRHGIDPQQVTPMDRLAFVGDRGSGSLCFIPVNDIAKTDVSLIEIATLGIQMARCTGGD